MKIMLFGASGLVGGLLAPLLASHDLIVVGRRASGIGKERVARIEDWPGVIAEMQPHVVVSTLGTTISKAGSRDAFAAIDHDAVVAVATAGRTAGARQFIMVSSVGADARSSAFYIATKGRAEASVTALGYERLDIFRPGLLVGERTGDPRFAERLAITLSPLTNALTPRQFDRYRAIAAADVASAMARAVGAAGSGVHIHHNREMLESPRNLA
ncbi:NAD-dependent epimerase/dehydratase family protein [Sphingomonas sp. SUN039]|uniref:NAD-dependent epimerase/dehydratase family protein n=1 Tax=Sphingomonas sp. SUN039 TaxID=2937787 RepID=UPI002164A055|nr:NAD-dependent epimerase/dehydratase family protein [Sphingomonas sp. SUN039]UVO54457.1 NAD-dependent dehydratase [Sphingomonas sp. SUN039]